MRTTVHKHLRLQHRRHTGRVLHRRHTSYRGLAIVVGLAGALMIAIAGMARAAADSLMVSARNPAPIPTIAAIITSPTNNAIVHDAELVVSGTCEAADPANIVTILDNGHIAGSTPCMGDGAFSIFITIELGTHTLIARTYTITDDTGPDSEAVTVTRTLPPSAPTGTGDPSTPSKPNQGGQTESTPLTIVAKHAFIVFGPSKDAVWVGSISGGKPPYRLVIDWGDGDSDEHEIAAAGEQRFTHHYKKMRPYIVAIGVTDAKNQHVVRQYAAVTPFISSAIPEAPTRPLDQSALFGLYGAYLLVLVIFGGLWVLAHPNRYALAPVPVRRPSAGRSHRSTKTRRF